jgi:hypothetical protein
MCGTPPQTIGRALHSQPLFLSLRDSVLMPLFLSVLLRLPMTEPRESTSLQLGEKRRESVL